MKVNARRCDQCLFGEGRIVSAERMAQILRDCARNDQHFTCHKSSIRDPDEDACCHDFYEAHQGEGALHGVGKLLRFGRALNYLRFIDPDTGAPAPYEPQAGTRDVGRASRGTGLPPAAPARPPSSAALPPRSTGGS